MASSEFHGSAWEATVRDWIDSLSMHPFAWAIEYAGKWIGEIRLDALDERDRRAKLAIGLYDPQLLGRGLGREAITLWLSHAFTLMSLHRVSLRSLPTTRERSIAMERADLLRKVASAKRHSLAVSGTMMS